MRPLSRALVAALLLACSAAANAADVPPLSELDALLAVEVSSASRSAQRAQRAPGSVTVITHEQIERFGYRTLAEALAAVPGLYLSYDRNYTYLGVRGFSRPSDYNNRILLLLDGVRLNEDVFGAAPVGTDLPIDLRAVERIEVVRGPGSSAFGTAAMLAVVNIVLRRPEDNGAPEIALEAGSLQRGAVSAHGGGEVGAGLGASWSVAGFDSEGDAFRGEPGAGGSPGPLVHGADRDSGWGATALLRRGGLQITALASSREKAFPTGAWETPRADPDATTVDAWSLLAARWRRDLPAGWSLTLGGQAGHYAYDGVYPSFEGPNSMDSTDNSWLAVDGQLRWETSASHRITFGGEYRDNRRADYRELGSDGELYSAVNRPFTIAAAFVEDELQLGEDVVLTTGLRYDRYGDVPGTTSPRAALVWLPNADTSIKLLYGRAFRAPNLYESWYDPDGTRPDLEPERVETLELSASWRLDEARMLTLSLYDSTFRGLIEQVVDPDDRLWQFRNSGTARSHGGELELTGHWASGVSAYGSVAVQRTHAPADAPLTNSPQRLLKAGVALPLLPRLHAAADVVYESSRLTVQGTRTDEFLLVDGLLRWSASERLDVELQVRNLLDSSYALPGGFEHTEPAIEQDGRTFTLRLARRF